MVFIQETVYLKKTDGTYVISPDEFKSTRPHCSMQPCDSIMCGYFCIKFIAFVLKGESLLGYTNLVSPNDYEKIDKIILKYFQ